MRFVIVILIFLAGCDAHKPLRTLTEIQKQYLSQLPLAEQAYMESCNNRDYLDFAACQKYMMDALHPANCPPVADKSESTGTSIVKTAVGTAVGYGAAKLILGK